MISRNVDVGQTVAASLQAPTLFTVAQDLHKIQRSTPASPRGTWASYRDDGLEASFVVDAYPSDRFTGVIQQVRNAATTVQNVVTYDAVIAVENPDLKLRPGMTANATIVYNRREDTLRVPNAALRFRPPAGRSSARMTQTRPSPPGSGRPLAEGAVDASQKNPCG